MHQQKPALLVVEDNLDVRLFIKGIFKNEYEIYEASNGEEGMKISFEEIPDLIINDLMMPKVDGFEMCDKIKSDERTSHIPVIMLTAKATNRDKIEGYETGADDYITKPFDEDVLRARVKNLLEQRKKLREHFAKDGLFNLDDKNITSVDRVFLQKVVQAINNHISDTSFGVESFASEIALSRVTLHKKLVSLIGEPPSELIKRIRLSKAAKLLQNKHGNISEIALDVGFNNPAYFSECFRKQFGVTPSQYQQKFTIH
jgi:DNA-binding response OmpR family regulator